MDKHEKVSLIAGLNGDVDYNSGEYYNQIDIYTVAKTIDFIFTDEVGANYVCRLGALRDATQYLPEDLYELWEDRITVMSMYDVDTDDTYIEAPVAIDISGTKVQEYFGLNDSTCYLMLSDLSGHEEYMQGFLQMLYDIETGAVSAE